MEIYFHFYNLGYTKHKVWIPKSTIYEEKTLKWVNKLELAKKVWKCEIKNSQQSETQSNAQSRLASEQDALEEMDMVLLLNGKI